ncbi:MAG: hypothetical protein ACR2P7_04805, partial [bacterium]
ASDGGFYLLGLGRDGLRRLDARGESFDGIAWGGAEVAAQVRARARDAGMRFAELPMLRDIDRYADLEWLADQDHAYRQFIVGNGGHRGNAAR